MFSLKYRATEVFKALGIGARIDKRRDRTGYAYYVLCAWDKHGDDKYDNKKFASVEDLVQSYATAALAKSRHNGNLQTAIAHTWYLDAPQLLNELRQEYNL